MAPASTLRAHLERGTFLVAPGAPDSLTARLVARAGFPAVYMTGFGATASRLGMPDIGLLTLTEMAGHARDMVRAVSIPVIADADTGYGGPTNIRRTIEEYLQAGVAALHLEDQQSPKRCGQLAGLRLVDAAEAALRLQAAIAARGDAPLVVIARTDALPVLGVAEAADRARRYRDAGADLVFVDGIKTVAEVEAVARAVPGPKVVSIVDGTDAARLTTADLAGLGFSVALYAVTALFAAARATADTLAHLAVTGSTIGGSAAMTYPAFAEVVGLAEQQAFAGRFEP